MKKNTCVHTDSVAIIGAACRFPGNVVDLPGFWQLLENSVDAVTTLPEGRCDLDRYFSKNKNLGGHCYTRAAGIIPHTKDFDPDFFGISRKEAQSMDPQQRLALETAWEALEYANIPASQLRGTRTGVYMGASNVDTTMQSADDPSVISPYSMTGSTLSIIANRVSYLFDLQGPSITVDTACSSSLVAVHLACEALRSGQIPLAIAGGVNVLLAPYPFIGFSRAHMLSPDGQCKVFDAEGNGYVRSEGAGVVVLKPLAAAIKDGDTILAVIAGSGVNADGRTTGISLPSAEAQATLLEDVYTRFSLDKSRVVYVEAHGTGTAVGDPIEAKAIGTVLGKTLHAKRKLPVGSVKGNIGHMESAAGMGGILKSLLVLQHGKIPPNIHFTTPNPAIDFDGLNITVPTAMADLPDLGGNELISVNSFGFGGANGHVVLQKYSEPKKKIHAQRENIFPFSFFLTARSEASLCAMAGQYATYLDNATEQECYDAAATLALRRDHLKFRAAITAESPADLVGQLKKLEKSCAKTSAAAHRNEAVIEDGTGVFVFSGNGSQRSGMGTAMLATNPDFTQAIDEIDSVLYPLQQWSIKDVLRNPEDHSDAFDSTEKSQPLLFAVQVALTRALAAKGILPSAVFGHSVGEIAAAYVCGGLSLEDAAKVIHFRSFLQAKTRDMGGMAVVNLTEMAANELLSAYDGKVSVAAVNTESSLTIAGESKALRSFLQYCKQRRIVAKMLAVPYPFHTQYMDVLREDLLASLADITPLTPKIPFLSTAVSGEISPRLDTTYWWHNVRQPVLFANAMQSAIKQGHKLFLEIGPQPILRSYLRDISRKENIQTFLGGTLTRQGEEPADFESSWTTAWQQGWKLHGERVFTQPYVQKHLPPYAWNREFLWPEDTPENRQYLKAARKHPLLGWQLPGQAALFENTLLTTDMPWLADHVAGSSTPYPAAAFIETLLAAAGEVFPGTQREIERLTLLRPLMLGDAAAKAVRVAVDKEDGGVTVEGKPYLSAEPFGVFARGRIVPVGDTPLEPAIACTNPDAFGMPVERQALYESARRFSLHYGPAFQTVDRAWIRTEAGSSEVLAKLGTPDAVSAKGMLIAPPLVDGAFQTLFLLLGMQGPDAACAYLPAAFERVVLFNEGTPAFSHAKLERVSPRSVVASFRLLDEEGRVLMLLSNCRFRRAAWLEHEKAQSAPYVMNLEPLPHPRHVQPFSHIAFERVRKAAERGLSVDKDTSEVLQQPVHPFMLLQLSALTAVHELVLSLCDASSTFATLSVEKLLAKGVLAPTQEPWLRHMLERLEGANLAEYDHGEWKIQGTGSRPSATILWRTLISTAPGYLPESAMLAYVTREGRAILAGKFDEAEHAILPEKLLTPLSGSTLGIQPYIRVVSQCVKTLLRSQSAGEEVNILQLAGDSRALFSHLQTLFAHSPCRYVVAEKTAAAADALALSCECLPEVTFTALDIANPSEDHLGKYHLLLAVRSLHEQTASLAALENCFQLLAPGGVLCLLEDNPGVFQDFVYGAQPSWWKASADASAPVSLLQTKDNWAELLRKTGFTDVVAPGEQDAAPGSAFLLIARKSQDAATEKVCHASPTIEETTDMVVLEEADTAEQTKTALWIIIAGGKASESDRIANLLQQELQTQDKFAVIINENAVSDFIPGDMFSITNPSCWETLLQATTGYDACHVVYLAGYASHETAPAKQHSALQQASVSGLVLFAQAWDSVRKPLSLWVLTAGSLAAEETAVQPSPFQGGLAGFTRVLMQEMRQIDTRLLDIHDVQKDLAPVFQELFFPTEDREIVFLQGVRHVSRLIPWSASGRPVALSGASYQKPSGAVLAFDMPGRLQNLHWKEMAIPEPAAEEVCIKVHTAGLNYRDVMWSMGVLLDEALENGFSGPTMGIECSGVITAVGKSVKKFAVGDEVLCFAPACFSTHVVTSMHAVARKPATINFNEAATIPVVFMTAWYSLKHLANMQHGERILIHGAAGGVGLAAVQIAAHLGLEIYATAGSAEKHHFLRELGVKHIFSSRSLSFAAEIKKATQGGGVDAVLNSLAGEAIAAGISTLRPFGRFIELGKRDFYADTPMRLRPFSNNLSYFGVDIDQLLIHQPALGQKLFAELMELFANRELVPLPHTVFPAARTVEAFQIMQQSAHMGKLVVEMGKACNLARPREAARQHMELQGDATYLVTGGTGGFGLATAIRLAARGAKHLLLLSRSGVKDDEAHATIDTLRRQGIHITVAKVDVADATKLKNSLKKYSKELPPLRGVIHAAAVLEDGMITGMTPERMHTALGAKALGAWNLHEATQSCKLDFFVLYSSATTAFGNPGQSGYVAANCMLETLAAWRRKQKLPAQVIGWGPIADTGMLQRNAKAQKMLLQILGVHAISSAEALNWLEHCIATDVPAGHYFGLDWHNRADIPALASPRFARLRPKRSGGGATESKPLEHIRSVAAAEGKVLLTTLLLEEVAAVLRLPADRLAADTTLVSQGMDSLMAVELGLAMEQKFALSGYTPSISDKTTAIDLADALYPIIMGIDSMEKAEGVTAPDSTMLDSLERKHGINLSNEQRSSVLESLNGDNHG